MELKGTVLNVVDFGAFVNIGLKDSGLVHISQLANRYVKSPHDVVSVSDVVTVWVMGVDQERKRVSLTMVKPGTERHRGAPSGGRRGGGPGGDPRDPNREREPRGGPPGQGRRGGPGGNRGPRPTGSALTSPPVGAPSVAVLAETPSRRSDRDHGRGPGPGPGGGPRAGEASGAGPAPPRFGRGPGSGGGPPGSRGPQHGHGGGRPQRYDRDRIQDRGAPPRSPSRPSRPSSPPPPLSKDALAGNVPLRTFGQLKQLWEARVEGPESADVPQSEAETGPSSAQVQSPHESQPPDSTNTPVTPAEPEPPSNPN